MFIKKFTTVIILLYQLIKFNIATNPCCQNINLIVNKKCSDGSSINGLSCPNKYMINNHTNDGSLIIDKYENLILEDAVIPLNRYCLTYLNGTEFEQFLICFSEDIDNSELNFIIQAILGFISVVFIVLTIAVYIQLPDLLDLQGICILHSISGLALTFVILGTTKISTIKEDNICLMYAYMIYFCSLYTFFWLNTLSFHIWKTTLRPKIFSFTKYWPQIYHLYAIGGTTAFLILLLIAHYSADYFGDIHPGLGESSCWFKSMKLEFVYFYGPISLLLGLNIFYYAWTIVVLWKDLTKCDEKKTKILKYKLILCVKLFIVMGITWIFEILSASFKNIHPVLEVIWTITDIINSLQGILIFLILVMLRKKVLRGLANRTFCGKRLPNKWKTVQDDECEEIEEEFGLS